MEKSGRVLTRLPPAHFPEISAKNTCNFSFICNFLHTFVKFSLLIFNGKQDGDSVGDCFSTPMNQVSQYDVGSTAKILIIHFDQERFE